MTADAQTKHHQPELPADHTLITRVTGGLDGAVRVAMMLRGRSYRVRDLTIDVREEVVSEVSVTVVVTATEAELLLKRLRRLPAVISAENPALSPVASALRYPPVH
jgi:hypothetical protein